jgi:hypothetical protein
MKEFLSKTGEFAPAAMGTEGVLKTKSRGCLESLACDELKRFENSLREKDT